MDGSNSRKSEANATRKRRSSILKSQRPPRTPLSELEFNVATPTDNAKSRRVSFSRRNGVAEFEITEATTAWKNVYEEHIRSDLDVKSEEQPVRRIDHLGSRITGIDFEDVEANIIDGTGAQDLIISFCADNQECTSDDKTLPVPLANFNVSEFTNHKTNQLFDNDVNPAMREVTNQIDVDFSMVAPLGDDLEDDLDPEKRGNMSHISVDLNATHFSFKAEESVSDMSITDTIHSPKVAAAKTSSEKQATEKDVVADKENIVMNPYVAPLAADNFAVNDGCEEVLIFDGKKCKFQSDLDEEDLLNPLVLNADIKPKPEKRKTIVFNDDAGDISMTQAIDAQIIIPLQDHKQNSRESIVKACRNDSNLSMTQAVPTNIVSLEQSQVKCEKHKTILYDDLADISMTQVLPSNILGQNSEERRKTIVYDKDDGHISMTETVPANIMLPQVIERRKTILYDSNNGEISMTQIVPSNIMNDVKLESGSGKTIVYDDIAGALEITQAVPTNAELPNKVEKRNTILFNNDSQNISMTQALVTNIQPNIIDVGKRKTIVFEDDAGDISVTQAIPGNLLLPSISEGNKRKTIVFEDEAGNISMTQTLVTNIQPNIDVGKRKTIVFEDDAGDISVTQAIPGNLLLPSISEGNKRKTIVFEDDAGNISMTQALVTNIQSEIKDVSKRKTIVFEDDAADISVTQAIPSNLLRPSISEGNKRKTIVFEDDAGNISMTQALVTNIQPHTDVSKRKTIVFEDDAGDISVTQAISGNLLLSDIPQTNKRKTIVFEDDAGNVSMTQCIPSNLILPNSQEMDNIENMPESNFNSMSMTQPIPANLVHSNSPEANKTKSVIYEKSEDVSIAQAVPMSSVLQTKSEPEKITTNVNENNTKYDSLTPDIQAELPQSNIDEINNIKCENDATNISVTKTVPNNILQEVHDDRYQMLQDNTVNITSGATNKRRTVVYDEDEGNMSITESVPPNKSLVTSVADKKQNENTGIPVAHPLLVELMDMSNADGISQSSLTKFEIESPMKSKIFGCASENFDMSIPQVIAQPINDLPNKNTTISDDRPGSVLMTKPIPAEMISIHRDLEDKLKEEKVDELDRSYVIPLKDSVVEKTDVMIYEAAVNLKKDPVDERVSESNIKSDTSSSCVKINSASTTPPESQKNDDISLSLSVEEVEDSNPQPMEEDSGNSNSESIIEIRSESTKKEITFADVPDTKNSILKGLLDMSHASEEDKDIKLGSGTSVTVTGTLTDEVGSNESCLLIKDSNEEQIDKSITFMDTETAVVEAKDRHITEGFEGKHHGIVSKLQNTLSELKSVIKMTKRKNSPNHTRNRSELGDLTEHEELNKTRSKDAADATITNKTINNANNTNALLDMLSQFTDSPHKDYTSEDEDTAAPITFKGRIAIEHKPEPNETRRSIVPDRKSMIRSREDLLKDISMAQAMMKCEDENMDDSANQFQQEYPTSRKSSMLINNDVVKTLKFDEDDSIHETSTNNVVPPSPLKKTAFGETTYIQEPPDSKTKVIPSFLKDVPEDLKQLMNDLVKPMADVLPFRSNTDGDIKRTVSTCSNQMQANLLTSSQIDIDPDLESNTSTEERLRLASEIKAAENKFMEPALLTDVVMPASPLSIGETDVKSLESEISHTIVIHKPQVSAGPVLVFDQQNPLNNVLLPPICDGEVHRYNPLPSSDSTTEVSPSNLGDVIENRLMLNNLVWPSGKADTNKPNSVSQSVEAIVNEKKDSEVNTVIVMKKNRELLEASSSLTLVDDALVQSAFDVEIDSRSASPCRGKHSPVQVIFKIKEPVSSVKLDSDLTSNDDDISEFQYKGKKRNYSPSKSEEKHCRFATDLTPKPVNKMQKFSKSPKSPKTNKNMSNCKRVQQCQTETDTEMCKSPILGSSVCVIEDVNTSRRKSRTNSKYEKSGTTVTIQQILTEYETDPIGQRVLDHEIVDILSARDAKSEISGPTEDPATASSTEDDCRSVDIVSSLDSGRELVIASESEGAGSQPGKRVSLMEWQPELLHEMSSKNLVTENESGVNVIAKIDMLPFMGTTDCEWETRCVDAWSFRLLRSRLRLVIRLKHRHDNATKSCVRADTPVRLVVLEQPPNKEREGDVLASLCVRFAAQAMRVFAARCRTAGEAPALLRRCAAVARVALRWGRAMHAARAHLAYHVTENGDLSLKVANIPLRSIWEVTMRIEMVASDQRETPWPRATHVRVSRVVAECAVRADACARLLATVPHDWGHAPRTVWKIFKYLKRKKRDDDVLIGV